MEASGASELGASGQRSGGVHAFLPDNGFSNDTSSCHAICAAPAPTFTRIRRANTRSRIRRSVTPTCAYPSSSYAPERSELCAPENINIDFPPDRQWTRIGVHDYARNDTTYVVRPGIKTAF